MKSLIIKSLLIIFTFAFSFFAISAQISQAQIEQFKRLPPSQQQALASSMGVDLSNINDLINTETNKRVESPSLNDLVPERKTILSIKDQGNGNDNEIESETINSEDSNDISLQFAPQKQLAQLKPFGYNLFSGEPTTFAPVTDVPIPADYVLGPGDTLSIQLYGKETVSFDLTVNRQGNIDIPKLGPINIAGQSFSEAKNQINSIIKERKIGVKSNISMGELRSIRVFVLGEAYRAASYTLSSLSTVTQALYAAGGINDIGSLRNIQVKRRGDIIAELDLYQLLLNGDTSGDINLMAGDVVFIPTVGSTVGINGEVYRPAIYELKTEQSINDVLNLAGGVRATAYNKIGKIARINESGLRSIVSVDLSTNKTTKVKSGDVIEIASVLSTLEQSVTIKGHVARPGTHGWYDGLKLSSLLRNINDFSEQPDLEYILVTRKNEITGKITSYSVNYSGYIEGNDPAADFALRASDTVYVFNKQNNRSESLAPLLNVLKSQTEVAELPNIISIKGAVRNPGNYPLTENATVNDILNAGMGYTRDAEIKFALLARKNSKLETSVLYVDLTRESTKNIKLSPLDELLLFDRNNARKTLLAELVKNLTNQANKFTAQNIVTIKGDVRFSGQYPYVMNMSSEELINLAGGLKESSYLLNADLVRFNHNGVSEAKTEHKNIDLKSGFLLQPLDTLHIKRIPDWQEQREIKLAGEVVFPGNYVLQKGETLSSVISRAGGLTKEADALAALFTREALKIKETEQIAHLSEQLENETAQLSLTKDEANFTDLNESSALLKKLNKTQAVGRLVIDLPLILSNTQEYDIRLDDNDTLYIPKKRESISVLGEVQYATSHLYKSGFDVDDYLERSGGLKTRADEEKIYIIKADGSVRLASNANWFSNHNGGLSAGDTIVVPLDLEYKDGLTLWSAVTQIIYNSAVAVAAIGSL